MKNVIKLIGAMALTAVSVNVFAIPIATVGGVDTLVDYRSLGNSGDAAELQVFADYLGVDASTLSLSKVSGSAGTGWDQVDENSDLWAFDLGIEPSLFVVKTGENTGVTFDDPANDAYDTFLFENVAELGYAVIDLSIFTKIQPNGPSAGQESSIDIFRVSHVSVTDGETVPEPSVLGLLAIGLLGLVVARRRTTA